jgi:branched-chain amino acid transport system permease protein
MDIFLQLLVSGLLLGGIYVLISVGLTLVFGVMKIVNFAHGDFLMLGMFGAFFLFQLFGLHPYLSMFLIAPAMFLLGLLIYRVIVGRTVSRPPVVQIFAFIGLSVALQNLALVLFSADFRAINTPLSSEVLNVGPIRISLPLLVAFLVAGVMTVLLFLFLHYTFTGKAIRSASQDRFAATLMGVSNQKIYALTFAIGLGLLGIAGALLIPIYSVYPTVGEQFALIAFVVVVLGGLGSLPGAVVGGLLIGLIETLSSYFIAPSMKQLVYFCVFILILILRPNGLFGKPGSLEVEAESDLEQASTSVSVDKGKKRSGNLAWRIAGILALLGLPLLLQDQDFLLDTLILMALWSFIACSWNIVGGYGGMLSLGHAAFFGIGAYTSTILFVNYGVSPWIGMLAGALLAGMFGLFIGVVTLRLHGPFFSLCTIAVAEILMIIAINWQSVTHGSSGIPVPYRPGAANMMFDSKAVYFYLALLLLAIPYGLSRWIHRSHFGYYLIGTRENEPAALALGINSVKVRLIAMVISSALTAMGGTFYAQYIGIVEPLHEFSFHLSAQIALMAIIGGIGTAGGPVFGAILITLLGTVLRATLGGAQGGMQAFVYGVLLVVVVLFIPQGMVPWFNRFLAKRKRGTVHA